MNTEEYTEPFPVEWHAWRKCWDTWRHERVMDDTLQGTAYRFPRDRNFMADEVLGVWRIDTHTGPRPTELSEVTFRMGPNATRYVGITYGAASGTESGGIARSFAELEHMLGIGEWRQCDECERLTQASDAPDWPNGVCEDCDPSILATWRVDVVFDGALEAAEHFADYDDAELAFTAHVNALSHEHGHRNWRVDIYDESDGLNPGQPVRVLVNDPVKAVPHFRSDTEEGRA